MASTASMYQPRHLGSTPQAARRSEVGRALVDLDRALALLNARIDQGDLTAISLFLKLRPLPLRRDLALELVSA